MKVDVIIREILKKSAKIGFLTVSACESCQVLAFMGIFLGFWVVVLVFVKVKFLFERLSDKWVFLGG